jgi:abequosyltransferase
MNQVILSICIPTYNRARYLEEAIRSITSQLTDNLLSKVEICISDNASTDETDEMLASYKEIYGNIVSYKWDENMGADRNYLKVIEIASGKYCWYLGSDDSLLPGSIERILQEIQAEPDILLFDRADSDITLTQKTVHVSWSDIAHDYAFHSQTDREKFLYYLDNCNSFGALFSYLSVIVFKRSRWNAIGEQDRFAGSAYVHTDVLLQILCEGAFFQYIKQPFVLCRMGNDSFLSDNSVRGNYFRVKLDVDGYRDIPIAVFGAESEEYARIHRLVGRCMPVRGLLKFKLAFFRTGDFELSAQMDKLLTDNGFYAKRLFLLLVANRPLLSVVNMMERLFPFLQKRAMP